MSNYHLFQTTAADFFVRQKIIFLIKNSIGFVIALYRSRYIGPTKNQKPLKALNIRLPATTPSSTQPSYRIASLLCSIFNVARAQRWREAKKYRFNKCWPIKEDAEQRTEGFFWLACCVKAALRIGKSNLFRRVFSSTLDPNKKV